MKKYNTREQFFVQTENVHRPEQQEASYSFEETDGILLKPR